MSRSTRNSSLSMNNKQSSIVPPTSPKLSSYTKPPRGHHHIVTMTPSEPLAVPHVANGSENTDLAKSQPESAGKLKGHSLVRRASDSHLQKGAATKATSAFAKSSTPQPKRTFMNPIAKKATVNQPLQRKSSIPSDTTTLAPMDTSSSVPTNTSTMTTTPKSRLGPPKARSLAAAKKLALPSSALNSVNGDKSPTLQSPTGVGGQFVYIAPTGNTSPVNNSSGAPSPSSPIMNSFITSAVRRKSNSHTSPSAKSPVTLPQTDANETSKINIRANAKRVASLTKIDVADSKMPRQSSLSLQSPVMELETIPMDTSGSEPPYQTSLSQMVSEVGTVENKVDQEIFSPVYHSITMARSSSSPPVANNEESGKASEIPVPMNISSPVKNETKQEVPPVHRISQPVVEDMVATEETDVQDETPEEDEFDPFYLIRILPPLSKDLALRPHCLPKKTRSSPPITLVLDLDETLVHCSTSPLPFHDMTFTVDFNSVLYKVCGRIRPHYKIFLDRVSQLFEVVIFTASQKIYADQVLDVLDPEHKYFRHRLFRDSCLFVAGNYLKDLNVLGRDLSKTIIVDNSPQAFGYQLSNGIPITSWYEDNEDKELLHVLAFLESIANVDDVRPYIRQRYQLEKQIFGRFLS